MTDADTCLVTLPNGVRALTVALPHVDSVCVSAFVRVGSRHERAGVSGISHFAEHMVFKGTATRTCQQINFDAERLGADANAHTDKDHTAFHLRGLAEHTGEFVAMLGDLVGAPVFPEDELARERQVILQELSEVEDDPFDTAFQLFDRACYRLHPMARPVIGRRGAIERIGRAQLQAHAATHYTGANVVVAAAGRVAPDAFVRRVEQAFGGLPPGVRATETPPMFTGGTLVRPMAGHSQAHVVFGAPAPAADDPVREAYRMAAAVLGEGMSSPLMDTLRERLGIVYYAGCSADADDLSGQFVVEASMAPEHVGACADEVVALWHRLADGIGPRDWERARNQLAVRSLRQWERPERRLEDAVLDCCAWGRVRSRAEREAARAQVTSAQVAQVFATLLAGPLAVGAAGRLPAAAQSHLRLLGREAGAR